MRTSDRKRRKWPDIMLVFSLQKAVVRRGFTPPCEKLRGSGTKPRFLAYT
jgi:hypothetical protein